MRRTVRHCTTGAIIGLVYMLIYLLCISIATPALAITEDQQASLSRFAGLMTEAHAEIGSPTTEAYLPSLNAYAVITVSGYSIADVPLAASIGQSLNASIHERFVGITLPSLLDTFATYGIADGDVNILAITYSSDGYILYLSLNGVDLSTAAA